MKQVKSPHKVKIKPLNISYVNHEALDKNF